MYYIVSYKRVITMMDQFLTLHYVVSPTDAIINLTQMFVWTLFIFDRKKIMENVFVDTSSYCQQSIDSFPLKRIWWSQVKSAF